MAAVTEGGDGAAPDVGLSDPNLVFWDLESCRLSKDLKEADIFPRIIRRLSEWGYSGPVQMLAVGDYSSLPTGKLVDTGILIRPILSGKRSIAVLSVMSSWVRSNPAPANLLVIAGDRWFPKVVESFGECNYNVLHRQQECMCHGLENHVSYCWSWSEVFDGGRPLGNLKRSRDDDGPSLLGEPMEGWSGPDVSSPCKLAPS